MAICGPARIPHSHFLGGPPIWTEFDRQKQRLWQRREAETHSCGVHPDVWDPERGGDPNNLRLVPRLCVACEIAESEQKKFAETRVAGQYQVWQFGSAPSGLADQPGQQEQ